MSRRVLRSAVAILLLAGMVAACGGAERPEGPIALTASPLPPAAASPRAQASPEPQPSPSPTPSPTGSPSPSPSATAPTDTDRARFVASHRPEGASDLDSVAADLDGDDTKELVFVYVHESGRSRIEVAWWQPEDGYRIGFRGEGGPADRVEELRIRDLNADGLIEIATFQDESSRRSLALWQVRGAGEVVPLTARGGCHAGSHVYGVIGAEFVQADDDPAAEINASCNDAPLPVAEWSRDLYDWRNDAYRVEEEPPDQGEDGTEQD